jgi:type IV pilus assembly protein PilX
MMTSRKKNQEGFVLIVALVLLAVVSLLAVNGMGVTTMNERMAGNHMDRGRAYAAAERALTQAQDFLRTNANQCLAAGCVGNDLSASGTAIAGTTILPNTGSALADAVLPNTWPANPEPGTVVPVTDGINVPTPDGQPRSEYLINWLSNPVFNLPGRADCKSYSVMGRGFGIDTNTTVLLQTVAHICPAD